MGVSRRKRAVPGGRSVQAGWCRIAGMVQPRTPLSRRPIAWRATQDFTGPLHRSHACPSCATWPRAGRLANICCNPSVARPCARRRPCASVRTAQQADVADAAPVFTRVQHRRQFGRVGQPQVQALARQRVHRVGGIAGQYPGTPCMCATGRGAEVLPVAAAGAGWGRTSGRPAPTAAATRPVAPPGSARPARRRWRFPGLVKSRIVQRQQFGGACQGADQTTATVSPCGPPSGRRASTPSAGTTAGPGRRAVFRSGGARRWRAAGRVYVEGHAEFGPGDAGAAFADHREGGGRGASSRSTSGW